MEYPKYYPDVKVKMQPFSTYHNVVTTLGTSGQFGGSIKNAVIVRVT